jgi:hypothetical protein
MSDICAAIVRQADKELIRSEVFILSLGGIPGIS